MKKPITQAVILCGGKGTRLGDLARDVPKPLVEIGGEPLLDRTLRLLAAHGIERALLMAGHLGEQIEERYEKGVFEGVAVTVFREPEPLGTAGALPLVKEQLDADFLLVYGDVFVDFDVSRLLRSHEANGNDCLATLLTRESDHPWDSHLVEVDETGRVSGFIFEQEPGKLYFNRGNVAIYGCSRDLLEFIPPARSSDFGRDVFPAIVAAKRELRTLDLEPGGFVRDMGTPDRLALVGRYLERKKRSEAARKNPKPLRVAFLDRDGTLNKEAGQVSTVEQIELLPGVAEAVARLSKEGWRCFILTNQPAIARGLCDEETLARINGKVVEEIVRAGGAIEQVYYSPYHPETHHGEGVLELRRASDCRKPGAGMLYQAAEDHDLDLAEVVMIGDSWRDVIAGKVAGVRTCFLGDEETGKELGATYVARGLSDCVDKLLSEMKQ